MRPAAIGFRVAILGFAARSGTSERTLLLRLLPLLKGAGLRIAAAEHANHAFEILRVRV